MNNNLKKNFHKTVTEPRDGNTSVIDTFSYDTENETNLTIFGHTFTLSELRNISRFTTKLKLIATPVLQTEQSIPDGSIFIVKIANKDIEISFGGLSKK